MKWEVYATGCHLSSFRMESTAPMAKSKESHSKQNLQSLLGYAKIGAMVNLSFSMLNACCWALPQTNGVSFFVRSLSSHATCAELEMNQW